MLTFHAGYFPTTVASVRPPAKVRAVYISPTGNGSFSGADWANAAPLTAINNMIAKAAAINGEVWLRADVGDYTQVSALTVSNGGKPGKRVKIRGVDVNGLDMMATIVGNRASPWSPGAASGSDCFRLNAGSDHLHFAFLRGKNQGSGFIRVRQPLTDLTITDCEGINVSRFFENLASSGSASVQGLTIQRILGRGYSKNFIRIQYDTNDILIDDVDADGQRQDGDNFAVGIGFYGTAHNAVLNRCVVRNNIDTLHAYQNCDGYSGELGNHHITLNDCKAFNITDGGCDFKGDFIVLNRCHFEGNHRNYRLWGLAELHDCVGITPTDNAGNNPYAQANISAFDGSMVRVYGGEFHSGNSKSEIFRAESGGILAISPSTKWSGGSGYSSTEKGSGNSPNSIVTTLDPNDRRKPIISSPTNLTINENLVGKWTTTEASGKIIQLRILENGVLLRTGSPIFAAAGFNLLCRRQDFEDKNLPNPRVRNIVVIDTNGNFSDFTSISLRVNDVADDPIAPSDLIADGVTDFAWWDMRPGSVWQDIQRTIPAVGSGDDVRCVDDVSGHGHHWFIIDENAPAKLRLGETGNYIEVQALEKFQQASPSHLRFTKVTCGLLIRRATLDNNARNLITFGVNNTSHWGLSVVGGASARMTVAGSATAANGTGALVNNDVVLTLQTEPVEARSNSNVVIAPDVPDVPSLTYSSTSLARLFCDPRGAGTYSGRWYGGWVTNRTETQDFRFRLERQFGSLAGLNL
jgi:hypothetical protein